MRNKPHRWRTVSVLAAALAWPPALLTAKDPALDTSYLRDHDVYVFDLATQTERQITTGGSEPLSHGLAEFVAQEEMARLSGYWWSPDGRSIAYEEADARDVEIWHVADPAHPEQPAQASY